MCNYKICIMMATFNGEKYLEKQIESILNQSYSNWQLIVNDDKSTDNTYEILKKYQTLFPNKISIYQNETNSGSAKINFMDLIKKCPKTFDYYMFSDQDDVWLPDKILKCINILKNFEIDNNKPIAFYSDLIVVDKDLNIISNSFYKYINMPHKLTFNQNLIQNNVAGCTLFFNNIMLKYLEKITDVEKIYMHDWIISLIGNSFGNLIFINDKQILYRQHENNSVGAKKRNDIKMLNLKNIYYDYKNNNEILINQARLFYNLYGYKLSKEQNDIVRAFINTSHQKKLTRIFNYYKYGLIKKGFMRKIKQIIFG